MINATKMTFSYDVTKGYFNFVHRENRVMLLVVYVHACMYARMHVCMHVCSFHITKN